MVYVDIDAVGKFSDKPDLFVKLVGIYEETSNKYVEELELAIINNDHQEVEDLAYKFKYSSRQMGAFLLSEVLEELEVKALVFMINHRLKLEVETMTLV